MSDQKLIELIRRLRIIASYFRHEVRGVIANSDANALEEAANVLEKISSTEKQPGQ